MSRVSASQSCSRLFRSLSKCSSSTNLKEKTGLQEVRAIHSIDAFGEVCHLKVQPRPDPLSFARLLDCSIGTAPLEVTIARAGRLAAAVRCVDSSI